MNIFGDIWNGIVAGLNFLLQAFNDFTGNYGVSIILLTVLVKLVLLPLTIKQTRSMVAMQKIQPEIKKLQDKYKDDKERLSQEMMKFYKENKVNPLGGCLPLLLQMPIFFALFTVLRKYLLTPPMNIIGNTFAVIQKLPMYAEGAPVLGNALYNIPFTKRAGFLWISNLADSTRIADPTFIFIILLAATTWFSQKQVMTDPRQKNMLIIMPLVTAFIGWSLPAGVSLYWLTTNFLQIIQQFAMEWYEKRHPKEAPKPGDDRKTASEKEPAARGSKGPPAKAQAGAQTRRSAAAKGQAKPAGEKQKAAARKGAPPQKSKAAAQKGGKKPSSQVRRPKGPPPQQKKPQKGAGGKGGTRKR
ncbi:MAG: membrane protein insertase YidC [Actinomycetota bacterium]|nr:membrane protein insertase YidC [Actinomycetota bacterium]MDD5667156.1 membrane protein insertase YidC [Actinomycetota bacterium]